MTTKTTKLAQPIVWNGATIEEVTWRVPTWKDIKHIARLSSSGVERDEAMLMHLTEKPSDYFAEMRADDVQTILAEVSNFLLPRATPTN